MSDISKNFNFSKKRWIFGLQGTFFGFNNGYFDQLHGFSKLTKSWFFRQFPNLSTHAYFKLKFQHIRWKKILKSHVVLQKSMFASTKIISKRKEWTSEILISWQCRKMAQTVSQHMIATQNPTDLSFSHHSQCVTLKLSTKQKVSLKLSSLKSSKLNDFDQNQP